jgi:hypothetical protein
MKRSYLNLLQTRLKQFPAVALLGPRQCGKTTLLAELPRDWRRFDLENAAHHQLLSRDPDLFFRMNPRRVVLDEAQRLPAIFPALRVAIDADRSRRGRFVITGSSSPALLRSITESLAGRAATIEMAPFSLAEAYGKPRHPFAERLLQKRPWEDLSSLKPRWSLEHVHRFWLRGGYPEPWLRRGRDFHSAWMDQYVQTYLQRDLARLYPGINQDRFASFLRYLGLASGDILNYSEIGRALGLSSSSVMDYFDIAHGTYVWRKLPAWERRASKRLVRHPKGYLRDSGLHHHFTKIPDLVTLLSHPRMGASWEGFVIEEILRGMTALGISHEAYYYRTGAGAEVDLVLEGAFGLLPIEIKHSQSIGRYDIRALKAFVEERNCRFGLLFHNGERVEPLADKIWSVPVACL